MQPAPDNPENPNIVLFICHATGDKAIGDRLKNLLAHSLALQPENIRYTASHDTALRPGQNHSEQLARECTTAPAFVALVSSRFLVSAYPMFELGARWGSGKKLIPVQLRGLPRSSLPAPIGAVAAVDASDATSLRNMLVALHRDLYGTSPADEPSKADLAAVVRLNRGWHRIRLPSPKAVAIALAALSVLVAAVALRFWGERERLRPAARDCRDGLTRLTGIRTQTTQSQTELARNIQTDTSGCDAFLTTVVGD